VVIVIQVKDDRVERQPFVAALGTAAADVLEAVEQPIETLTAYTVKPAGRRGVMTVDCGLDVPDGALRARAQLLLPRLRAAYVQVVQIYAGGLPSGLAPNPDFLARSLQRSTDEILGRRGARLLMGAVIVN